ncbi:hypothetical protein [Clostridium polynesiense]|uniref:hypothetical protein n=1 Tax=Clostridium polynesiense TaxID=1325933 RepID=UPI00058EC25C|nr:hypothetical protein [Clostridium polynesiense]
MTYYSVAIALVFCVFLGVIFSIIGIIGTKKVEKELGISNGELSDMERKRLKPYIICRAIGYFLPIFSSFILIYVVYKMYS